MCRAIEGAGHVETRGEVSDDVLLAHLTGRSLADRRCDRDVHLNEHVKVSYKGMLIGRHDMPGVVCIVLRTCPQDV